MGKTIIKSECDRILRRCDLTEAELSSLYFHSLRVASRFLADYPEDAADVGSQVYLRFLERLQAINPNDEAIRWPEDREALTHASYWIFQSCRANCRRRWQQITRLKQQR